MAFSVSKSRPFRSLGLYKSSGKHAAPKGSVPGPRKAAAEAAPEPGVVRHPAHAATSPRLNSPGAPADQAASAEAAATEKTAA